MLPLAYGLASGGPTGLVPATLLLLLFGFMSGYTMTSYADMAEKLNVNSVSEIWSNLVSQGSKVYTDIAIFCLCFGCCVFYSAFMGDIFAYLSSALGVQGLLSKRWIILAIITSLVLTPLSLLDDLSSLAFSSKLGVVFILLTLFVHVKRNFDGTYAVGGKFYELLKPNQLPTWPMNEPRFNLFNIQPGILILVNMLCVAYLAHYNAINYYKELTMRTVSRYRQAVAIGYSISLLIFSALMIVGYNMFGLKSQPLLLNNFHKTDDVLATVARVSSGLAITFAYPLMFAGYLIQ